MPLTCNSAISKTMLITLLEQEKPTYAKIKLQKQQQQ